VLGALQARIPLNDGHAIPALGLGVWQAPPGRVTRTISCTMASESGTKFSTSPDTVTSHVAVVHGRAHASPTSNRARASPTRFRASQT